MNEIIKTKVDFSAFIKEWNAGQGQATPQIHIRMAEWLEIAWKCGDKRLLLQVFRAGGKSTVAGLFAAWLLYRHPNLRILVLAADEALAVKMVRQVKRIIEKHELCKELRPAKRDQWAADRFTVERAKELRDPSMLARGIESNITGSRADVVICDDVEVPNTCDTPDRRRALREQLAETAFVMAPDATQLYIGTPHSWYTIYADAPRPEIGEERAFLEGFERLTIPIMDADGQSAWPERYAFEDIERLRRAAGPHKFGSQMMLQPVNIAEGRLDPSQLVYYRGDLVHDDVNHKLFLQGQMLTACGAWWDPAFGDGNGDSSVLAVVFRDEKGSSYLHHVAYLGGPPDPDPDAATAQCRQVAELAQRFHLPSVTVEINGLGRFLPQILKREMGAMRVPCAVAEASSTRSKELRILEAFDVVLAARALNVHESVRRTPFIVEMQEWRPGRNSRDDGLDAVAGAACAFCRAAGLERFAQAVHSRQQIRGLRWIFQTS